METISAFDADLARLKGVLAGFPTSPPVLSKSPIIPHVEQLEEHAEAIAGLLESLTRHYDQCCLAMKELEIPVVDPVAAAERNEMLAVLETDGEQVDDAVKEIEERLASMEDSVTTNITPYMELLSNLNQMLVKAFMEFDVLQNNLSVYLVNLSNFEYNQAEYTLQMDEKLSEMDGLRDFYETFRTAYSAMLEEAGRRAQMQEKRNEVLKEAMTKLRQIDDEDMKQRENFRLEQGQFLPTDIWPALMDSPPKYVFSEAEPGYNEFGDGSMDNLKKTVLGGSTSNAYALG
jgi:autophagy-related protein 17